MPRSPSGSYSPRTPTRRSGSSTPTPSPPPQAAVPARWIPIPIPPAFRAPTPSGPRPRERVIGLLGFVAVFLLLHFLFNDISARGPGAILKIGGEGIPGLWLLERFLLWWPILFVAAYLGLCLHRPVRAALRWGVLLGYVALLILTILPSYAAPAKAPDCLDQWAQLDCLPNVAFPMLLRFAPIPAMLFLFSGAPRRWSISRAAGLGLMFFSLWRGLYGSVPDLVVIAGGGGVASAVPAVHWYYGFFIDYFWHLVYPLFGLLLFFHRVPRLHGRFRWGENVAALLRPLDAWVRRSVAVDLAWGCALFLLDLAAFFLVAFLLQQAGTGSVGDDSAVFNRILLDQVFLIAIIAGVGEELLFRGILQGMLHRLFGRGFWNSAAAILIQALAFGALHAGYQDLDHLLVPLLFGVFIGIAFRLFGILAAILVHIEIDILAFTQSYLGTEIDTGTDLLLAFLVFLMLLVNLVYPVLLGLAKLFEWLDRRRAIKIYGP